MDPVTPEERCLEMCQAPRPQTLEERKHVLVQRKDGHNFFDAFYIYQSIGRRGRAENTPGLRGAYDDIGSS